MSDKIIAAAREAGWSDLQLQMASPAELDRLAAFYRLAYQQGMERAAEICEAKHAIRSRDGFPREASTARALASSIRAEAHAQNQPKTTHDSSVVSKK